ncbi:protein lin-9 homolog isoform X1 [Lates japonicus]|uniref:Protein lin-9 homolog isoform X1 n=1 Tax=Lates japonicus TaxID=270547 RepID=A0AAD3MRR4_LATJO|nr:protein lin-9 homolog isoform X1 [Lates japonicus]
MQHNFSISPGSSAEALVSLKEGSLSNTLNEKNSFPRAHNTRGRHSSLTMDTAQTPHSSAMYPSLSLLLLACSSATGPFMSQSAGVSIKPQKAKLSL